MSTVTVWAGSWFGDGERSPVGLLIRTPEGERVERRWVTEWSTFSIPYGRYQFTVSGPFIVEATQSVTIHSPKQLVFLPLQYMVDDSPDWNQPVGATIEVSPYKSCRQDGVLVARMFSVYGGLSAERVLSSFGYALFEPIAEGVYVAVVLDGNTIRAMEKLKVIGPVTRLKVQLSPCEGEKTAP